MALAELYLNQITKSTLLCFSLSRKHPCFTITPFVPWKIVSLHLWVHIWQVCMFTLECICKADITKRLHEICTLYMDLWLMARFADKSYLCFCLPLVDGLVWIFYESCTYTLLELVLSQCSTCKSCMCSIERILDFNFGKFGSLLPFSSPWKTRNIVIVLKLHVVSCQYCSLLNTELYNHNNVVDIM